MSALPEFTDHFGGCPVCWNYDACINVESTHFLVCHAHKKAWCVGSNLFGCWRHETEEEWQRNLSMLEAEYELVESAHCGRPEDGGYINEVALRQSGVAERHAAAVAEHAIRKARENRVSGPKDAPPELDDGMF